MAGNCITWTPERIQQLREYRREGLTLAQIASRFGVAKTAVSSTLYRLKSEKADYSPRLGQTVKVYTSGNKVTFGVVVKINDRPVLSYQDLSHFSLRDFDKAVEWKDVDWIETPKFHYV